MVAKDANARPEINAQTLGLLGPQKNITPDLQGAMATGTSTAVASTIAGFGDKLNVVGEGIRISGELAGGITGFNVLAMMIDRASTKNGPSKSAEDMALNTLPKAPGSKGPSFTM